MSIYFLTYKSVTLTYKLIVRLVSLVVLVMRLGVQGALMGPLSDDRHRNGSFLGLFPWRWEGKSPGNEVAVTVSFIRSTGTVQNRNKKEQDYRRGLYIKKARIEIFFTP